MHVSIHEYPSHPLYFDPIYAGRLDIIGRVAFGHDFNAGHSTESLEIAASWHHHVNMGLTFGGFVAPLLVRTFPWIVKLPISTLQAQGTTKMIVTKLANRILGRAARDGTYGRDILSLLLNAQKQEKKVEDGLTSSQIVDNVRVSPAIFKCDQPC